ncbi:hypothetical protein PR202_gb20185 [Eleusine coracana subsp. coracana]|uniref:Nuclear transcription factor Y subunit n=1 Tax=Eleusine coracana subsp. coracana TaxID=191504 RepID=A0AAV5F7W3_ELECO|nr:hypothetical protein PR202_gb20185 [Eleusine coracana subsp. coracana]
MMKSVLSLGNPETAFSSQKFDYSQSFACVSYPYAADSYYGGILTGYTSHANAHPQINGTTNSRVPLPIEPASEDPIFVNAKQYHAILRRRQARAKLEAQNKLVKVRKLYCFSGREFSCDALISLVPFSSQPYLHESRHHHAMKRARGSGGRFLNKNELQEQQQKAPPSLQTPTGGFSKMGNDSDRCTESSSCRLPSTSTSSGISSASDGGDNLAHQEQISFSSTNFFPSINFNREWRQKDGCQWCVLPRPHREVNSLHFGGVDIITSTLWCARGNSSLAYEVFVSDNNLVSVSYEFITELRADIM